MTRSWAWGVIGLWSSVGLLGCDPCDVDATSPECTGVHPVTVTVELQSALIGPGKLDRTAWDGDGTMVSTEVWSQLATALAGANPYAAAAALLVNPVLAGTKAPDPLGTARLDVGQGIGLTITLADPATNMEDTYATTWSWPAIWQKVPIDMPLRIRVSLTDEDLVNHDAIGVAELNNSHLRAALMAGQVYHVPVADQTNQQILFLGISVRQ